MRLSRLRSQPNSSTKRSSPSGRLARASRTRRRTVATVPGPSRLREASRLILGREPAVVRPLLVRHRLRSLMAIRGRTSRRRRPSHGVLTVTKSATGSATLSARGLVQSLERTGAKTPHGCALFVGTPAALRRRFARHVPTTYLTYSTETLTTTVYGYLIISF